MKNEICALLYCYFLILIIFINIPSVRAEGFCDGSKIPLVESLICSNTDLLELDKSLNKIYFLVLKNNIERQSFTKNDQRKWLKIIRNQCDSKQCLETAYNSRIIELNDNFLTSLPISEKPLSNKEAKDICESIASYADTKALAGFSIPGMETWLSNEQSAQAGWTITEKEKAKLYARDPSIYDDVATVYKLRLKQSGSLIRFGRIYTGGTCASYEMFNIDYLLASSTDDDGIDKVDDPKEEIRWAYWGGEDYPIFFRERMFIITADIANLNKVGMVSWIKPDGRRRPLCLLSIQNTKNIVVSAKDKEFCTGIAQGAIHPLPWKQIDSMPKDGGYADTVKTLNVDINGDGTPENVGLFHYASGAGCGSEQIWLAVLSEDLKSVVKGPLNESLSKLNRGPMNIYSYNGKVYTEGVESDQKLGLVQVVSDKIDRICEFENETKTEITNFFDVETQLDSSR